MPKKAQGSKAGDEMVTVTYRLPRRVVDALDDQATSEDRQKSVTLRRAIEFYLERVDADGVEIGAS